MNRVLENKFNRDVLWNMGSLGVLSFGGLLVNIIVLRFRGAEALGIFNQVYAIYVVASQIGVGGLQFSTLKHVSHNQNDLPRCADITGAALILILLISGIVCVIGYFLYDFAGVLLKSAAVSQGIFFILPGLLFFSLNKVLIMVLNGLRHMRSYAVFKSVRYILLPLSVIAIIAFGLPDASLTLSLTLTEIILFAGLFFYINWRLFVLKLSAGMRPWFREHAMFGLKGVLGGVLVELDTRVDVLMLGYFSNDTIVGIYSFAAMLAEGIGQIPLILRQNVDPIIGRYFAKGDVTKISQFARKLRITFYPFMALVGIAASLCYPILFMLSSSGENLTQSWTVFTVIMVGIVINAGYRPFLGIMMQGGRPEVNTYFVGILLISNVIMNAFFIPLLGIYGAAVVNVILYSLEAVLLVAIARKLFGVRL